jgi:hypothetical protein
VVKGHSSYQPTEAECKSIREFCRDKPSNHPQCGLAAKKCNYYQKKASEQRAAAKEDGKRPFKLPTTEAECKSIREFCRDKPSNHPQCGLAAKKCNYYQKKASEQRAARAAPESVSIPTSALTQTSALVSQTSAPVSARTSASVSPTSASVSPTSASVSPEQKFFDNWINKLRKFLGLDSSPSTQLRPPPEQH